MSRAQLFADAIDTLYRLGWAALGWLCVAAAVATVVLFAGTAVGAWGVSVVRRRYSGPSWARGRLRARIHAGRAARAPQKRVEHHSYREAA